MIASLSNKILGYIFLLVFFSLAACSTPADPAETPAAILPPSTFTPAPPTATTVPLAAMVNGEAITLAELQAEMDRFLAAQAALGNSPALEEAAQRVLDDLINQLLLAQGARAGGFVVDDAMLQSRIENLAAQVGGPEALAVWMTAHGYTEEAFRQSLRRAIAAAWMRDQIIAAVPSTAEQVHVQQILFYNTDAAQQVLAQLNGGSDFADLAARYAPITQGELGWFPRGYLPEPQIEEAAFALQPGQISEVIASEVGFHIIKVIERDPQHPLSPDATLALQNRALMDWLEDQRQQSTIVVAP